MRKGVSITNRIIIDNLIKDNEDINFSEVVEVALLYYLGKVTPEYVEVFKQLQEASKSIKSSRRGM